ncbi:unnamed protein product [Spirodela intermedia]|uniref:Uncharacterized protein n=1 Tax=Spirodela intermedia TaxID=51605 RepID=A0A7I8JXK6_SPIIN|nr:unnamed protein product [Spirodela intermedia]
MGQAMGKLMASETGTEENLRNHLRKFVVEYLEENHKKFEQLMESNSEQKPNLFYHFVYKIVEEINARSGAIQYDMPNFDRFKSIFKEVHPDEKRKLTKEEFRKFFEKAVGFQSVQAGQGFKEILLLILGVPVVATFAKRAMLGKNSQISDDVLIPVVTSATVVYLAKSNKL